MRWIKHMTDTWQDEKICEFVDQTGLEGYGFFWRVLEILSANFGTNHQTFSKYSVSKWRLFLGISSTKFKLYAKLAGEKKLFTVVFENNFVMIDCPRLPIYHDEYTARIIKKQEKCRDSVPTLSGETTVRIEEEENRIEEKRRKEIYKEKDIDIFSDHLLKVLKLPLSDKGQTELLIKSFGLEKMINAVDRMGIYFDTCKKNKWTEFIIGKHWRNLYQKIEYFSSDENLKNKLREIEKANKKNIIELPNDRCAPGETIEQFEARRAKDYEASEKMYAAEGK